MIYKTVKDVIKELNLQDSSDFALTVHRDARQEVYGEKDIWRINSEALDRPVTNVNIESCVVQQTGYEYGSIHIYC